jgi:pimeloyl-ACP methyl ester carboxylesterase
MTAPAQLLFLAGASGDTSFWRPAAGLLRHPAASVFVGWPGFGPTPADPDMDGVAGLAASVAARIDRPTALIAQSMGCVVALLAARERLDLVTHLVLAAASGGVDVHGLGGRDWQAEFLEAPRPVPDWFATFDQDLSALLQSLAMPALLLWGDADPISPVAVGQRFAGLLPDARLHVVAGGTHALGNALAGQVAPLIHRHLAS